MPRRLNVTSVADLKANAGISARHLRVSSGPKYDEALLNAFPHFMYVSYGDARVLTDVIEQGMRGKMGLHGVGSYASTVDHRTGGKVLWLSDSSYATLEQWLDKDEYTLTQIPIDELWNTPTHIA